LFDIFAKNFWPGPLTLVCKKDPAVSSLVTAGNDFVGLRVPNHPVALRLLEACDTPLVAPSANRSGHVSPTTADHVWDDLKDEDITIISCEFSCSLGIESTVVMIQDAQNVVFLRPGFVGPEEVKKVLKTHNLQSVNVVDSHSMSQKENTISSPGQDLKHYAPRQGCFVLLNSQEPEQDLFLSREKTHLEELSSCFIIDFNGKWSFLKEKCSTYLDLSLEGNFEEASRNLFHYLRLAEKQSGILKIAVAWPSKKTGGDKGTLFWPLADRIFRAASGFAKYF
jgi:hypothetical protein